MESSNQEPSDSQKRAEKHIREFASRERASKWDTELVILFYILSVSLDPLLLYSLILNDDRKCVVVDTKLQKIAIVLRSLADLSYIWSIIRDMLGTRCIRRMLGTRRMLAISRMLDVPYVGREEVWSMTMAILAVLPVPQMAILVFFPRLRASRAVNRMKIMNSLILLQYVPRLYPIYRHCKNLNKNKLDNHISDQLERKTWVPGLLNFIIYILASYVFGAFWYFFSIQRQIECWGYACQSGNGCEFRIFDCDDGTLRNVTLLNDLCPINPSNAKVFDFGIYLDALQSGMLGSTDFPQKVLQCFSWGVRNLSSFGSNLETSMNASETLFVVFISISGLLLFIYLLGHLQTFMQATNKEYWIRQMWWIPKEIKLMLKEYGLSNAYGDIIKIVRRRLRREEDLAVENLFSILPVSVQRSIKRYLLLPKLKEVPTLQGIDQMMLDKIFLDHFEQVMYDGGNCIIREGEPLDMMILISRGSVLTYKTSTGRGGGGSGSSNTKGLLTPGDFYGQELITWATDTIDRLPQGGQELITWAAISTSFSDLPISKKTLKSHEKVEVFAIRASALLRIFSKHKVEFQRQRHSVPTQQIALLLTLNEHGNS